MQAIWNICNLKKKERHRNAVISKKFREYWLIEFLNVRQKFRFISF